jgi:hypothetical protein
LEHFLPTSVEFPVTEITCPNEANNDSHYDPRPSFLEQVLFAGGKKKSNVRVDRAARVHSTFAAPGLMRNASPPLRSNELLDFGNRLSLRPCSDFYEERLRALSKRCMARLLRRRYS